MKPDLKRTIAACALAASLSTLGIANAQEVDPIDRGADPVDVGVDNVERVDPIDTGVDPVDAAERTGALGLSESPRIMGVSLEFIRDAEVIGMAGEEIGEVQEVVRSAAGAREGLLAVVNVDNGWFEEDRRIVVPLGRFTVMEGGKLRLDDVTAENVRGFEAYEEAEWAAVEREYDTYADAYEGYGWRYY